MAKFYVTFMFKQADNPPPQFPQAHPDGWLEVEAADELAARVLVTKTIGRQWAFIYDQRPDGMAEFPRGCIARLSAGEGLVLEEPAHRITDRGFKHLAPVVANHAGAHVKVKIIEASTAFEPHIWLSVGDDLSGTAHLTLDQAREVARQLVWLADHHYQVSNA
jgi:hypothetical protein